MSHLVFVYGTLKQGFGNNRVMFQNGGRAEKLGTFRTAEHLYVMCGQGFPRVSRITDTSKQADLVMSDRLGTVLGEVWSVNDASLAEMDRLEGHPRFYKREEIRVVPCNAVDDLKPVSAWMYLIPTKDIDLRDCTRTRADRSHLWTR